MVALGPERLPPKQTPAVGPRQLRAPPRRRCEPGLDLAAIVPGAAGDGHQPAGAGHGRRGAGSRPAAIPAGGGCFLEPGADRGLRRGGTADGARRRRAVGLFRRRGQCELGAPALRPPRRNPARPRVGRRSAGGAHRGAAPRWPGPRAARPCPHAARARGQAADDGSHARLELLATRRASAATVGPALGLRRRLRPTGRRGRLLWARTQRRPPRGYGRPGRELHPSVRPGGPPPALLDARALAPLRPPKAPRAGRRGPDADETPGLDPPTDPQRADLRREAVGGTV